MKNQTKQNVKDSLLNTGKNLGSGLVGMLAGSAAGRHSLWLGAAVIFGGAWYNYDWLSSAGVGMVASNGFTGSKDDQTTAGLDGFKDEFEKAKERTTSSLKALGRKIYLDKLSPSLSQKLGLGALEDRPLVFVGSQVADPGNFDTTEVDAIIRQLEEGVPPDPATNTNNQFQGSGEFAGAEINGQIGNLDIEELNGSEDALELNAVA